MSSPINRLPLLCRATRVRAAWLSHSDSSVSRHCATCVDCRAYFSTDNQLETRLRRDAPARTTNVPSNLESRILQAVDRSQLQERSPRRTLSWGLAALASAAVVAVATVQLHRPASQPTSAPAGTVEDVLAVASELPKQWFATVQPGATKLLEENPLQLEIASVSSDARSALDFLAMNFLPTDRTSRSSGSNPSQNGS
jgi:hypothetical protein